MKYRNAGPMLLFFSIIFTAQSAENSPVCTESGQIVCECETIPTALPFKIIYPNGGEILTAGSIDTIRFCIAAGLDTEWASTAVAAYSADYGKTWNDLLTFAAAPNERIFIIPAQAGSQCLIKVYAYDLLGDPAANSDISDTTFTISATSVRQVPKQIIYRKDILSGSTANLRSDIFDLRGRTMNRSADDLFRISIKTTH